MDAIRDNALLGSRIRARDVSSNYAARVSLGLRLSSRLRGSPQPYIGNALPPLVGRHLRIKDTTAPVIPNHPMPFLSSNPWVDLDKSVKGKITWFASAKWDEPLSTLDPVMPHDCSQISKMGAIDLVGKVFADRGVGPSGEHGDTGQPAAVLVQLFHAPHLLNLPILPPTPITMLDSPSSLIEARTFIHQSDTSVHTTY